LFTIFLEGIEETCHKDHMEILINTVIAQSFGIKLNEIYVNKKESECKSTNLNDTHVSFRLPFEKCFTKTKVTRRFICKKKKTFILTKINNLF
jgi:hypothetical protein